MIPFPTCHIQGFIAWNLERLFGHLWILVRPLRSLPTPLHVCVRA